MEERINFLLGITAIVQILIVFLLTIAIITSLPRIPTIFQPRIPVEANRTSKLKLSTNVCILHTGSDEVFFKIRKKKSIEINNTSYINQADIHFDGTNFGKNDFLALKWPFIG